MKVNKGLNKRQYEIKEVVYIEGECGEMEKER